MAEAGLHGQLGLFCWDILSESVYILLEQESLLLDGKNTSTQNHLQKEQDINSRPPSSHSHPSALLDLPFLTSVHCDVQEDLPCPLTPSS